eukprot:503504-Pleurochrysis_carterae.AAC.1
MCEVLKTLARQRECIQQWEYGGGMNRKQSEKYTQLTPPRGVWKGLNALAARQGQKNEGVGGLKYCCSRRCNG